MEEIYLGFSLSWQDPPGTTGLFSVSVAGTTKEKMNLLERWTGKRGSVQIEGSDRDDAIAKAKVFVRGILGHS